MKLLSMIPIRGKAEARVELLQGDLTSLRPDEGFDLLVVSAFPNDYIPTAGSLIGALYRKGLSVRELSTYKELDLREHFSCWLSQDFDPPSPDLQFRRLLCFEPLVRGLPPSVVGDIFRALTPILAEKKEITSVAMPILAAGDQRYSVSEMLQPLLEAAIHWLENGLPLKRLMIVAYSGPSATEALKVFGKKAAEYAESAPPPSQGTAEFDVFISYAHEDSSTAEAFEDLLTRARPEIKIFFDRKSIDIGSPWQPEIFESIDYCHKLVAMLSPAYLASKVCKEEFNIAWVRSRDTDQEIIFPIYLYTANLPTYMKYRNYCDCREGDMQRIEAASQRLLRSLDSALSL